MCFIYIYIVGDALRDTAARENVETLGSDDELCNRILATRRGTADIPNTTHPSGQRQQQRARHRGRGVILQTGGVICRAGVSVGITPPPAT
eukprot:gene12558-biopygen4191